MSFKTCIAVESAPRRQGMSVRSPAKSVSRWTSRHAAAHAPRVILVSRAFPSVRYTARAVCSAARDRCPKLRDKRPLKRDQMDCEFAHARRALLGNPIKGGTIVDRK